MRSEANLPDTALILAGGLGTRLRSTVSGRPKVLASVAGRPFLHYLLTYLSHQGVRQVMLCVSYLAEQVQQAIGDGAAWRLQVRYSMEPEPLGTGGALRLGSAGLPTPFFALNGDTLFTADLGQLWRGFQQQPDALGLLALRPASGDRQQRGNVRLARNGRILSFEEKTPLESEDEASRALTSAGVYILHPAALAQLPGDHPVSLEHEVFPSLAAAGQLTGQVQDAYFTDIGTPASLAAFEKDILEGKVPDVE